jgi:hypothetical protein
MTTRRRHRRQSGVILGIVLVLLALLFAAGIFALWSLRSDTGSAGRDRLSRQLLDCAEQGLAYGKQYFSTVAQSSSLNPYLAANICSVQIDNSSAGPLPCWSSGGPFPSGMTGTPPTGYPNSAPYTMQLQMDQRLLNTTTYDFEFTVGIYNDAAESSSLSALAADTNNKVVVYSRCTDRQTWQQRSVQALITITQTATNDYKGQAGRGFRNQGNQNF